MCELFGFSSAAERDLTAPLKEFFDHSIDHPNGWGIAELSGSRPEIVTEPVAAFRSRTLPGILCRGVRSRLLLAHIRRATIGSVSPENCHPFTGSDSSGRQWTLIHNGTIFNGLELMKYKKLQQGSTDSERVLLYFLDLINEAAEKKGAALTAAERFSVLEEAVASIAYRNKLNLIIYDSELLYAHVNMKNTLYYSRQGGTLISTVPLDSNIWQPLPLTALFAFRDGETVFRGRPHGLEFVDALGAAMERLDFTI